MYDASRLANFGRDSARAYASFNRASTSLVNEISYAVDEGVSPVKIAHDLMGRCSTHEARVDLLTIISSLAQLGKIPQSVYEPFEKGIRPKRV